MRRTLSTLTTAALLTLATVLFAAPAQAQGTSLLDSLVEVPSLQGFPLLIHLGETIVVG